MSYFPASATHAMESLAEHCEAVIEKRKELKYEREVRDDLVLDARHIGISRQNLATVTKLSFQQIRNIENGTFSDHYQGDKLKQVKPPRGKKPTPLAATMAMSSLRNQCDKVVELAQEVEYAIMIRDDLIKDARLPSVRVPREQLVQITGLAIQTIRLIEKKPYSEHYDGPHFSSD